MTELNGEIGRLTTAIDKNSKEQQSMASLENKVKEMALEILELQGQAADLNLLQEKIATSSDPSQMESELKSLTNENERESHQVERIFEDVKSVKEKVAALEKAIQIVSSFSFSKSYYSDFLKNIYLILGERKRGQVYYNSLTRGAKSVRKFEK